MIDLKVSFHTLGCKVNQFETDAMAALFKQNGYQVVDPCDKTDVFVINSCTVTAASDKKTRQLVNRYRRLNANAVLVLAGCYAQLNVENLKNDEKIDIIIGTKHKGQVVDEVTRFLKSKDHLVSVEGFFPNEPYEDLSIYETHDRTRANIKIQDGCRQFCAYCIIPFARGPIRSRTVKDILEEIQRLHNNGYREIVLNGIHISSYASEIGDGGLSDLIRSINALQLNDIRFRLGSLEPMVISEPLLLAMQQGHFCDHFHLSLQSGSDTVLKRMNRHYTTAEYADKVKLIRQYFPMAGITTDIITGFPGETDEEFQQTMTFVSQIGFSKVHVFTFSRRQGTKAYNMLHQIDGMTKKNRTHQLIKLSESLAQIYAKQFINKELEVLFEKKDGQHVFAGHATNYLEVKTNSKIDLINQIRVVKVASQHGGKLITEEVRQ